MSFQNAKYFYFHTQFKLNFIFKIQIIFTFKCNSKVSFMCKYQHDNYGPLYTSYLFRKKSQCKCYQIYSKIFRKIWRRSFISILSESSKIHLLIKVLHIPIQTFACNFGFYAQNVFSLAMHLYHVPKIRNISTFSMLVYHLKQIAFGGSGSF